jgi:hypothetical protein
MEDEPVPEPGATTDLAIQSEDVEAAAQWRNAWYWRRQAEQQHAEPGLRPALLRLALASLLQPRLAADARTGSMDLDVIGEVGAAVESALRFCGVVEYCVLFGTVRSVQFSSDGQKVEVSAGSDPIDAIIRNYSVRIWSLSTGECVQTLMGRRYMVRSASFSPDGLKVVSANADKTVRV